MTFDRRSFMTGIGLGSLGFFMAGSTPNLDPMNCSTPTPTPTGPASTIGPPTGRWLSGASLGYGVQPTAFAAYRGEAVSFIRIWADASLAEMQSVGMMDAYRSFTGTLEIGCGGPQGGQTWASAASGGMDATWRRQIATINAKWGSIAGVHLSMAHELNGNWYAWSVKRGQEAKFKAAWKRFYGIVQTDLVAKGRNARVTLNYNAEDVGAPARESYWPGDEYVDIVGVDVYDGLGNHEATLPGWVSFARGHAKPLSVPEWGLNPNTPRDNPAFITRMNTFFQTNVAMLAGESYFNEKASALTSAVPQARAEYGRLTWASSDSSGQRTAPLRFGVGGPFVSRGRI